MRSAQLCIPSVGTSIILREMSPRCSISACSHQLKSREGKKAPSAVFTPAHLVGLLAMERAGHKHTPGEIPLP